MSESYVIFHFAELETEQFADLVKLKLIQCTGNAESEDSSLVSYTCVLSEACWSL